jgi:tetratricopeptide (TPR) repeat protein
MKHILLTAAAALALATLAVAQAQPAPAPKTQAPAAGTQATPAPAQTAPAQAAPPVKGLKPQPQAKSQEEYNAFLTAAQASQSPDPAAAETAARDFQAKFPNSELTSQLYLALLFSYNAAHNLDKAADMGREVLKIDPTNPVAAVYTGLILSESTRGTDIDAAQKFDEAVKDANLGLQNADTNLMLPGTVTQEQVDGTKADLKATAYDTIGLVAFKRNDFPTAEKNFRQSIQFRPQPGDAMSHLRLALALDKQNKYKDALPEAQKAVSLANPQDSVSKSAQAEVERLQKLVGGGAATAPATQPATPPSSK